MNDRLVAHAAHCAVALAAIACIALRSSAQDNRFSQQLSASLLLDPALAGANSDREASLTHRDQWSAVGSPARSSALSLAMCAKRKNGGHGGKGGRLGVGLSLLNNQAGEPRWSTTEVAVHAAYHVFLDSRNTFGAGICAGFRQDALDPSTGEWASQYNGIRYDAGLPSGEATGTMRQGRLEAGAGVLYTFRNEPDTRSRSRAVRLNIGAAGYHAGQLLLGGSEVGADRIPVRVSLFANCGFAIGRRITIAPEITCQRQGPLQQIIYGSDVLCVIGKKPAYLDEARPVSFGLGVFSRANDAIIAHFLVEWSAYAIGISYDVGASDFDHYVPQRNAMEISLRYNVLRPVVGRS